MSCSTKTSHHATSRSNKVWNPADIIGIFNTDPGYQRITCSGYAPSQRRRCRNPIRDDNKEIITKTLNEIAYLQPDSPTITSRLRSIVNAALCVRWHQNQADNVLQQWQDKIRRAKPALKKSIPSKSKQRAAELDAKRDQDLNHAQEELREMRDLLAELMEQLRTQQCQDREQGTHCAKEGMGESRNRRDRQSEERKQKESEAKKRDEYQHDKEKPEEEELRQKKIQQEKEEQQERERQESEKRQRDNERAARNERIRLKAQKLRKEQEQQSRDRFQKEREEWDQLWIKYEKQWAKFKVSKLRDGNMRDLIPWPVKTGLYGDVCYSTVKEFLEMAVPRDVETRKLIGKELLKWHPDKIHVWVKGGKLSDTDGMLVDMICRVSTELLSKAAGRSSEQFP